MNMTKQYLLVAVCTFLLIDHVYAQQYVPTEQKMQMDKAMANAWVISADEEPVDELRKSFAKYTKDQLDVRAKKDGRDMMVAKEASVPSIAQHPGDLMAKFFTEGGETKVAMAFMPGYDISLSTAENPTEMENLRKFTKNFVKYYKTEKLTAKIEDQEKRKKSLESDLKKNEREYKSLQKNVSKITQKVEADKTEESKKFELKNEKIEDEARMMALDEVMENQRQEIAEVEELTQESRSEVSHLETLFAEPMARQDATIPPEETRSDSTASPVSSPDIDY